MLELTEDQKRAIQVCKKRYFDGEPYTIISGRSGVGKSATVQYLIKELGLNQNDVAYMSYTGKAALVLQQRNCPNAQTAHHLLYTSRLNRRTGNYIHTPKKILDEEYKLIIVDEISMLPKEIWELLLSHKIHVIGLGDDGQLPPLFKNQCHDLLLRPHVKLTQIMRQSMDNEIIEFSMKIRNGEKLPSFYDGKDIKIISKKDLSVKMLKWADQIICAKNSTRREINSLVRDILGFPSNHAVEGDKVVCLKNYWNKLDIGQEEPLINGSIGYLTRAVEVWSKVLWRERAYLSNFETAYGKTFHDLYINKNVMEGKKLPIPEKNLTKAQKERMDLEFEYGYCITGWKSQGSEWDNVLAIEEDFPYDEEEHKKFLYTIMTRASKKLILVRR